jgi:hypothetical protein
MSTELHFVRHPDDHGIDEVLFCSVLPQTHRQAEDSAFLRIGLRERYKTSGLSGDEWRFSTMLQLRALSDMPWVDTSSGYRDPEAHAAFLYAELFGDFRIGGKNEWLYRRRVGAIAFAWKGLPIWSASYDGEATDLLVACGHLPGALITAGEQGASPHGELSRLCCQPGCKAPLASVYRRLKDYCRRCGEEGREPFRPEHRGFCLAHLRRGDCALDDADSNYEVVSGPGPDGNEPDPRKVRESVYGGTIDIGGV